MKATEDRYLGFPEPLLGKKGMRLKVLHKGGGFLALEKPAGVVIDRHPWYGAVPSLVEAMNLQVQQKKPELAEYAIEKVRAIYFLEPEVTGVALMGINKEGAEELRNCFGSFSMNFEFVFLAIQEEGSEDTLECDLPLAAHFKKPCMVVSHKTGKRCRTRFTRLARYGRYGWWRAQTNYLRMHQIRLHAVKSGLKMVGEQQYAKVDPICLSGLKRRYKGKSGEKALYDGLCLHLEKVSRLGSEVRVGIPGKLKVLLQRLTAHLG